MRRTYSFVLNDEKIGDAKLIRLIESRKRDIDESVGGATVQGIMQSLLVELLHRRDHDTGYVDTDPNAPVTTQILEDRLTRIYTSLLDELRNIKVTAVSTAYQPVTDFSTDDYTQQLHRADLEQLDGDWD